MDELSQYAYPMAWGRGYAAVTGIAYYDGQAKMSSQLRAFHSHYVYIQALDLAPSPTRVGVALYHDGTDDTFCIIGWTKPLFKIEYPRIDRRN